MIDHPGCASLSEAMIDAILADSFPASDPPPWTTGRDGLPGTERGRDSLKVGNQSPTPAEKEAEVPGRSSHLEVCDV